MIVVDSTVSPRGHGRSAEVPGQCCGELDDREAAIEETELEIAEDTMPGDGVFLVGDDIEPGTYRGNAAGAGGSAIGNQRRFR